MHGIAKLTFNRGELIMPARSGYDRQLVFEEAERSARRHGQVRLELSSLAAVIRSTHDCSDRCSKCERPIDGLHFTVRARSLCCRCVRQQALTTAE